MLRMGPLPIASRQGGINSASGFTISPSPRRLDDEHVAGGHFDRGGGGQRLDAAVGADDLVDAGLRIAAALDAGGRNLAAVGEDAGAHPLAEAKVALDAVAALVAPGAARAAADGEALEQDRQP